VSEFKYVTFSLLIKDKLPQRNVSIYIYMIRKLSTGIYLFFLIMYMYIDTLN